MSERIKDWFDKLEKVLDEEARFAGLFEHNVTKGSIREFFVRRILRSFIPDTVHIGSGQIISSKADSKGTNISKQIDVVIYDNRFPYFRSPEGSALYLMEGTIATIEVKSDLTPTELHKALDNCFSASNLLTGYNLEQSQKKIDEIKEALKVTDEIAKQYFQWNIAPKTYIFAFKGYKTSHKGLVKQVKKWRDNLGDIPNLYVPLLPRLIIGEGVIGLTKDELISFKEPDAIFKAAKVNNKLGILASHLLANICDRMTENYKYRGIYFNIDEYNPQKLYAKEVGERNATYLALVNN